jgi:nucleoid-associated protein YgaU
MSITATRTTRLSPPAEPTRTAAPRRTVDGLGCSVGSGRVERPVLRIVAADELAPVFTRVLPPDSTVAPVETVGARRVRLDDFFAPEYDGDDQRLEIAEPRHSGVRLTRRGRVAVLFASVFAVVGLALAAASASMASDHPEQTSVVTVVPGQTLWDISTRAAGGGDVRSMMSHIEAINHLDSASIQAGQHLRIPR